MPHPISRNNNLQKLSYLYFEKPVSAVVFSKYSNKVTWEKHHKNRLTKLQCIHTFAYYLTRTVPNGMQIHPLNENKGVIMLLMPKTPLIFENKLR